MIVMPLNPNRRSIRVLDRQFLLDLNLREDGTGLARLSEVCPDGRVSLLTCALRYDLRQDWAFVVDGRPGTGATPQTAALASLRRSCGLQG